MGVTETQPSNRVIWQVYGYNKTAKAAAQEFARTHWAEPRKIAAFKPDGTFKVVKGLRTYRIFETGDLWAVEVVDDLIMRNHQSGLRHTLGDRQKETEDDRPRASTAYRRRIRSKVRTDN